MKWIIYSVCAVGGAALAAGLVYMTSGKPASSKPVASVMLAGIQGAPGDGNASLAKAFRTVLANIDIPVTEDMSACAIAVSTEVGSVRRGGVEHVSLVWQIHDAEGNPLGEVTQANQIVAGALDGAWGTEASLAARGARDGIVAIMRKPRPGCT